MPKAGKFNAERFNLHLREVTGGYAALIGSSRLKTPMLTSPIAHDLRSWSDYFMWQSRPCGIYSRTRLLKYLNSGAAREC